MNFLSAKTKMVLCVSLVLVLILVIAIFLQPSSTGAPGSSAVITAYTIPTCGACQRLAPEWYKLEQTAAPLRAVKVDCSQGDCSNIQKYPTIVCQGQEYVGPRTASAMKAWALSL